MGDEPVPPKKKAAESRTEDTRLKEHTAQKPAIVTSGVADATDWGPFALWGALAGGGTLWLGGAWWWRGQKRRRRPNGEYHKLDDAIL